ncbi:MAG: ABC transporter ATP-binding protein [Anaerolineaceae bacterium]|nr:ABC transporter ATP-binding protein [Anaerolineaceae bacterium]
MAFTNHRENIILRIEDLKVQFITSRSTIRAVDGISFSVREKETFGIVGESGSGKSVTVKSIVRLIHPPGKIVSGSIWYKELEMTSAPMREVNKVRGKEIAMIMQDPMTALNPVLRIREQIQETLEEDAQIDKKTSAEYAIALMRQVGIPAPERRMNEYPHQYSGGMRQRVMIAIALSRNPKFMLADEPTTAVDVTIQDQILKLLIKLQHELGMGMILVTHDLGIIAQTTDRVAVMYAGRIMEMTDTVALFKNPHHPYTIGLMNSIPSSKRAQEELVPIPGMPPNMAHIPPGCPFHPRCAFATDECMVGDLALRTVGPNQLSACIKDIR